MPKITGPAPQSTDPVSPKGDESSPDPKRINHFEIAIKSETAPKSKETGGREGLDPTRFGDWERAGRCVDF